MNDPIDSKFHKLQTKFSWYTMHIIDDKSWDFTLNKCYEKYNLTFMRIKENITNKINESS